MSLNSQSENKPKASSKDILGGFRNGKIKPVWRQHYTRLVELRELLERRQSRMAEAAKDEAPTYSLHLGDAGTDQYDQDMALSTLSSDQSAIYEIDEALNRIHEGTYGLCEITGEQIEPERLEAIPWTRFSLSAQETLERNGSATRTRFAPRRSVTPGEVAEEPAPAEESAD